MSERSSAAEGGAPAVDLNADLGEGMDDAAVLPFVTSTSIACGGHAGDRATMREAAARALALGVAVGAHPGFPDREGFGRRVTTRDPDTVASLVRAQVEDMALAAREVGTRLRHVKPHGALYNLAAAEPEVARAVARGAAAVDRMLLVYVLGGSPAIAAVRGEGMCPVAEGFADRAYRADRTLAARGSPGALVLDPEQVAARAVALVTRGRIETVDGALLEIDVETICIHGDTPGAAAIARCVRRALEAAGVLLRPPRREAMPPPAPASATR